VRLTQNVVAGLICLALSLFLLVLTRGLPQSTFVPVGPEFYPRIVLIIMAVLSALLVVLELWPQAKKETDATSAAQAPEKRNYRLVGVTYAVFAGYVVLLPLVGYRVATLIFVAALQSVLEPPRSARGWGMVLISAATASAVTYVVFNDYLSVLLPRGHWTGW
jgi:putative tricarboxylic transport membrane protein